MKRLEPNLLLALTCLVTLILLVLTSAVFGVPGGAVKYPLMAAICIIAFVMLNSVLGRRMKRVTPAMISLDAPQTAVWAALFPLILIVLAAIPIFWPGHDYGLAVIIGSVLTGLTIESALKARRVG